MIGYGELFKTFATIGLLSFGGPAGQIALMHRILVEEKNWLDEKRFLHALNFCMLLPGPEAMQLATYSGWLLRGIMGGLLAGALFVLPGVFVLLALSSLYVYLGDVPLVDGLLFGLKAAVLAIVFQALIRVSKKALKGKVSYGLALIAFILLAVFSVPFPYVILLAGLFGMFAPYLFTDLEKVSMPRKQSLPIKHTLFVLLGALVFWVLPVVILYLMLGPKNIFVEEALFFSKTSMVTFGGAYAVLSYVGQQSVELYHWLKPEEMLTGLGFAETTPGPLILVLVFVGFLGAFRDGGGFDPFTAGLLGAFVTVWVTFIPCFIWIFLGAPFMERVRGNPYLSGAFAAITASVVGVIANLSIWFAIHVLFFKTSTWHFAFAQIDLPQLASINWAALGIALISMLYLLRGGGVIQLLAGACLCGVILRLSF